MKTDPATLATRILHKAENDPRLLCRNGCREDDGSLCLASMAADLAGGTWAAGPGEELGQWLEAEPGDDPAHVLRLIHPHDRARRLLGVDIPLGEGLRLVDLRRAARG